MSQPSLSAETIGFLRAILFADDAAEAGRVWLKNPYAKLKAQDEIASLDANMKKSDPIADEGEPIRQALKAFVEGAALYKAAWERAIEAEKERNELKAEVQKARSELSISRAEENAAVSNWRRAERELKLEREHTKALEAERYDAVQEQSAANEFAQKAGKVIGDIRNLLDALP